MRDPIETTDLPVGDKAGSQAPATSGVHKVDTSAHIRTGPYIPSADSDDVPPPPRKKVAADDPGVPGYEIQGVLGKGGMGIVYKARHVALDRVVALKMILAGAHADKAVVARFEAEARAVARFTHPHIVQIYEVGEHDGLPFFSLEFVEGGPLSKKIARTPQDPRDAAALVETLARAMHYAHERDVIHRDLKPANILLAADGTPKITDFGLAKRLEDDSGQTQQGTVLGTPSYMAPEQATGQLDQVGPLADVYALGAVLYDLLTGRPPFVGGSVLNTLEMVRTREPVPPTQLAGRLPKDIETICLKCLQKDPSRRYATAAALADDLRCFLDGKPIAARPVGRGERAWRWAKRNPREAVLGSLVAALLLVAAVGGALLSWRLNIAKVTAETNARVADNARKDTEAARVATAQQRDVSVDVVRGVLTTVDDTLRNRASLLPVRERVLEAAMKDLPKIRDAVNKHPLEGRTDAIAYSKMADLLLQGGKVSEADELLERTEAILKQAAQDAPDDPASFFNLGSINNKRGETLLRLGNYAAARERFTEGLEMRKKWALLPQVDRDLAEGQFARSHGFLGRVNLSLGDPAAALDHYQQSRRHLDAVSEVKRKELGQQREVAAAEERIGLCAFKLGRFDDAEKHYAASLKMRQDLIKRAPKAPALQRDEALSRTTLGDFLLTAKKEAEKAQTEYAAARSTFERLLQAQPDGIEEKRDVAWVRYRLGVVAERLNAPPGEAKKHYEASQALREALANLDTKDVRARVEWMLALARAGMADQAEKLAGELEKSAAGDPQLLFQTACGLALASTNGPPAVADRRRAEAFRVLGALTRSGWKDRVTLETDPDLDPVRGDKRFADLLAALP